MGELEAGAANVTEQREGLGESRGHVEKQGLVTEPHELLTLLQV